MGYPINGISGLITSWTNAGTEMVNQLIANAVRPYEFTIHEDGDTADITGFAAAPTAMEYVGGLSSAYFDFSSRWPKSAPNLGDTGLLTFASGYVQRTTGYTLNINFGETDISSYPLSAAGWKDWMPEGIIEWDGSYDCLAVSDTALSHVTAVNTAAAAATFKMKECGAADASFSGNIVVGQMTQNVKTRGVSKVTYTFKGSGDLTNTPGTTGGPGILKSTAGVISPANTEWDANGDGVADITFTGQVATSRTVIAKAFLRSLKVVVAVGSVVEVSGTGRFSGSVAYA